MSVKPKTSLYQSIKFALVSVARMVVAGAGLGQKGVSVDRQSSIDGSGCGVVAGHAVVASLSKAESNGSDKLRR